jgi:DNA-binding response OmpR family regulator
MRILLAEDDPAIADIVKRTLEDENYEVTVAPDGTTAWDYLSKFSYNIAILDVMLPGINGLELCRRCRQFNIPLPIILLTALGTTDNIVVGLDSGADDYITKPFKIAELLARVRSLTRRANNNINQQPAEANSNLLTYAGIEMNIDQKMVKRDGRRIDLTATEFRLLEYFMRNAKRVLSRMDILEKVWGYDFDTNTKVVDVYINYLRKKIDNHSPVKLIHTVTGMGYVLKEE